MFASQSQTSNSLTKEPQKANRGAKIYQGQSAENWDRPWSMGAGVGGQNDRCLESQRTSFRGEIAED